MTSLLQQVQEQKALKLAASLALAGKQSAELLESGEAPEPKEYAHLVAGANTILPDGKKLTFYGKAGSTGFYSTSDIGEIDWLDSLCKMPGSQVTAVINAVVVKKAVDPAIAAAAADAALNSERLLNPALNAMNTNLGAALAQG